MPEITSTEEGWVIIREKKNQPIKIYEGTFGPDKNGVEYQFAGFAPISKQHKCVKATRTIKVVG